MARDNFFDYLMNNSIVDPKFSERLKKEKKIGRKKPKYCELHERLFLNFKKLSTNNRLEIVADHNHETGIYRGWICHSCNTQLVPEVDRLRRAGVEAEDIKAFFAIIVDYVFSDGKSLEPIFKANRSTEKWLRNLQSKIRE